MSDISKIIAREMAKLDRQEEAVRITRAHITALEQLYFESEAAEAGSDEVLSVDSKMKEKK